MVGGSATFGTWSRGLDTFENAVAAVTTYTPNPSEIGSTIEIFYTTNDPPGPCTALTDTIRITIEALPEEVIVNLPEAYCTQNEPFLLQGNLSNGVISGNDVIYNEEEKRFYCDPEVSGWGEHTITYSFQGTNGCTAYCIIKHPNG